MQCLTHLQRLAKPCEGARFVPEIEELSDGDEYLLLGVLGSEVLCTGVPRWERCRGVADPDTRWAWFSCAITDSLYGDILRYAYCFQL